MTEVTPCQATSVAAKVKTRMANDSMAVTVVEISVWCRGLMALVERQLERRNGASSDIKRAGRKKNAIVVEVEVKEQKAGDNSQEAAAPVHACAYAGNQNHQSCCRKSYL